MRDRAFVRHGLRFAALGLLWAAQAAGQRAAAPFGLWWARPLRYEPHRWSRHSADGQEFVLLDDGLMPRSMANVRCVEAGPMVLVLEEDAPDLDGAVERPEQALVLRADREVRDGSLHRRRDAQIEDIRRANEARMRRAWDAFDVVTALIALDLGPKTLATTGSVRAMLMSHRWLAADLISWLAVSRQGTVLESMVGYGASVFDECAYPLLDADPTEIAGAILQRFRDMSASRIEADEDDALNADELLATGAAHSWDALTTWPDLPRDWLEDADDPTDEGEGAVRVARAISRRVGKTSEMSGTARVWRLELGAWCGMVPDGGVVRTVVGTVGSACDRREWTPDCDADVIADDVAGRLVFATVMVGVTQGRKDILRNLAERRQERIAARFDAEFGRRDRRLTAWSIHEGRGVVEMRFAEEWTALHVWAHGTDALGASWAAMRTSEVGRGEDEVEFVRRVIEKIRESA